MGGDIVIVAAGEAESPRRDLPPAARYMYMAPICLYILGTFLVGFNVDYLDPNLYHTWAASNGLGSHSPFILAVQKTTIKVLPGFLNGCFLFSAYTAA
jgi:amino acid transporter